MGSLHTPLGPKTSTSPQVVRAATGRCEKTGSARWVLDAVNAMLERRTRIQAEVDKLLAKQSRALVIIAEDQDEHLDG